MQRVATNLAMFSIENTSLQSENDTGKDDVTRYAYVNFPHGSFFTRRNKAKDGERTYIWLCSKEPVDGQKTSLVLKQ